MARRAESAEPAWIDFPPRWPERDGAPGDPGRERPPVLAHHAHPRVGRLERPKVLRILAGGAPAR